MVGVDSVMRSSMSPLIRMEAARPLLYHLLDYSTLLYYSSTRLYSTLYLDSTTQIYGCGVAGVGFWHGD